MEEQEIAEWNTDEEKVAVEEAAALGIDAWSFNFYYAIREGTIKSTG